MSDWQIIAGDCLEVMAGLAPNSVDAIVTDPPYEIGGAVVRGNGKRIERLPAWDKFRTDWVSEVARVLVTGGSLVAFTDGRRVDRLWEAVEAAELRGRQVVYWVKHAPPPNPRRSFQSSVEVAVWATKGVTGTWNGGGLTPNVWYGGPEKGRRYHPTQKPLDLMHWLCRLITPPNGLILDPFAGSGSTGCAAVLEGFRFIGIEQDADYAEIARRRIAHHAAQATQIPLSV